MSNIDRFRSNPTGRVHQAYESSVLLPVAPEYTTGEVLLASAYRTLLTGERDAVVDLADIDRIPAAVAQAASEADPRVDRSAFREMWEPLVFEPGGLKSPTPSMGGARYKQLMPLVPQLSRVSGVLGTRRSRWQPGNLLVSTIYAGRGLREGPNLLRRLADSLRVDATDDWFAQFLEVHLAQADITSPSRPVVGASGEHEERRKSAAWRPEPRGGYLPSERFCADLETVIDLKPKLTRRQWTVLVESLLRLGVGLHQLWLCRLNSRVWLLCKEIVDDRNVLVRDEVLARCWRSQAEDDPLLYLSDNVGPWLDRTLDDFSLARVGINLLLWALEDCGHSFSSKLGTPEAPRSTNPPDAIWSFLQDVAAYRDEIRARLASHGWPGLGYAAASVADADPRFVSGAATRNLSFFMRYTLLAVQSKDPRDRQYDQGYLLYKRNERSSIQVRPGPSMLILVAHCCCRDRGNVPTSIFHFRRHLAAYGVAAPPDELRTGETARELERLGLVIDSPDAGGGRLLVDPFM